MTADAFDLAERLQTPVIVMSDLDLGMNDHQCLPLHWDAARCYDRGKVLDAAQLEALTTDWGRYLDKDGDGICYRTYPGTHPTKGSYFTRGTSRNEYSGYTEDSTSYVRNMERLQLKWETAKSLVPVPETKIRAPKAKVGAIFYGTTTHSACEAIDRLHHRGLAINSLRIRAFPFQEEVMDFIGQHDLVFVIEQNRDGQMRTLLINEGNLNPEKLIVIASFDGLPVASRSLSRALDAALQERGLLPSPTASGQGGAL
jgi:2-oxoglutarate ferredoxin oxidoreductase subunit alpha